MKGRSAQGKDCRNYPLQAIIAEYRLQGIFGISQFFTWAAAFAKTLIGNIRAETPGQGMRCN